MDIPYGRTRIPCDIAGAQVLAPRAFARTGEETGAQIVQAAMRAPIGSPPLCALAKGQARAVIIVSDHTRPVPSRDILPAMLRELRQGNPGIDVTLLVATGFHRLTTAAELEEKLGPLAGAVRIVVHDARDAAGNVRLGVLPSGAPLILDKTAAETDLLLAEGFIEPHFFAGFSGGRKSVLPGICDQATVLGNHCSAFIDSPRARTGILEGNPLHADMLAAARMARLRYIVNVVIDENKRTVAAFAGEPAQAHLAGTAFLRAHAEVEARPADIVITTNGGAPLDQNIYQCVKGLSAAEAAAKPGGVLILCAECADGAGGEAFYRSLRDCESPAALYASILRTPQHATIPDQWESQVLARILMRNPVIFVTRPALRGVITDMKMAYAPDLQTALAAAYARKGRDAAVTVIPDGVSVIVKNPAEARHGAN